MLKNIIPPPLEIGDTVALVSCGWKVVKPEKIHQAVMLLKSWGLHTVKTESLHYAHYKYAGTIKQRQQQLQSLIDSKHIKAIFFYRGGYGMVHLIDKLNYSMLVQYPKYLIGFSDVTVLLHHVYNAIGLVSLHATMPVDYASNTQQSLLSLKHILFGGQTCYLWPACTHNRQGQSEGVVLGGNLSVIHSLLATSSVAIPDNTLLFLEEVGESPHHIDRMFSALYLSGILQRLSGLIIGAFTEIPTDKNNPFGIELTDIVRYYTQNYTYPIAFNAPIGHVNDNWAIPFGVSAQLSINKQQVQLYYKASSSVGSQNSLSKS